MKKIITILIFSIFIYSCGEHEDVVFDNHGSKSLSYFSKNNADLQIPIGNGNETTIDIAFGVSTLSSNDRTIVFSIDQDNSNAPASMYSISSLSVVIPANEYNGSSQITAYYDVILDTEPKHLTFKMEEISDNSTFEIEKTMKVNISMFCPIPDDFFVGMYLIEQTSAYVDGPTLSDGSIVEVKLDSENSTKRIFSTDTYPNYCAGNPINFEFLLSCNEIKIPSQDTNCRCSDASDWFTAPTTNETYHLSDDSILYVTFTDDAQNDCGAPAQTTYKFTKQ